MLPPPRLHTDPAVRTWVNLPTRLWIDRAAWRTYRASVTAGGRTVRITGRPIRVVWDLGEATVVCRTPAAAHRPGHLNDCRHSYRRSSAGLPGGAHRISATVLYAVAWTCSGRCAQPRGRIGTLPATSTGRLIVGEIQSLVTTA